MEEQLHDISVVEGEIDPKSARRWCKRIKDGLKRESHWRKEARDIVDEYSLDGEEKEYSYFPILWSNVETLKPNLYSQTPRIEASRRFKDKSDVGRVAAMIIERATSFYIQSEDFDEMAEDAVQDLLLPGRGQVWIRYKPSFSKEKVMTRLRRGEDGGYYSLDEQDQQPIDVEGYSIHEDEDGEYFEVEEDRLVFEEVAIESLCYDDFLHGFCRKWSGAPWVARRIRFSKVAAEREYGEDVASQLKYGLPKSSDEEDADDEEFGKNESQAEVWEIWDFETKCQYFISIGYPDLLKPKERDPLGLQKFFPCPKPLIATTSGKGMKPRPDFLYYEKQADYINELMARKELLTKALAVKGVRDASYEELDELIDETEENMLVPIANWAQFMQDGGLDNLVSWLNVEQIAVTLKHILNLIEYEVNKVYEITGIADIVRGTGTNQYETAKAQDLKGRHVDNRLKKKHAAVTRFLRDIIVIVAEIIAEHFSEETIVQVAGVEGFTPEDQALVPEALALLKNDALRTFKLDIETDSTIRTNEAADKQATSEFITGMGQLMEKSEKFSETYPAYSEVMKEMMLMAARRFRAGRVLEGSIEQAAEQHQQMLAEEKANPQPDPKMQEAEAKIKIAEQEAQFKMQIQQQEAQLKAQLKQFELQIKLQETTAKTQLEREKGQAQLQMKAEEVFAKHQLSLKELQDKFQIKQSELLGEMQLEVFKAKSDAQGQKITNTLRSPGT